MPHADVFTDCFSRLKNKITLVGIAGKFVDFHNFTAKKPYFELHARLTDKFKPKYILGYTVDS